MQTEAGRRSDAELLSSFHEIVASIASSLSLDETLGNIARAMCRLLNCDVGAIYLVDQEGGLLRLRGIHGERSSAWKNHQMPLDRGMNAAALRTGRIQRTDDYLAMGHELQAQTPVVEDEPMRSVITAPMSHHGQRLGSMGAVRREVRPFDDRDLEIMEMLADHASIAVSHALAFQELDQARQRLQGALADLAARRDRELSLLREHSERTAALEATKSEFLRLVSHELRSPLTVLRGYLSMLADGTLSGADLPTVLPILIGKLQRMNLLVNEMLETARLDEKAPVLSMQVLDVRDVLQEAVRTMQPLLSEGGHLDVAIPPQEVPVLGDRMRLEIILTNLIDNAIKYSPDTAQVHCAVSRTGGRVEVIVRDSGVGIHPADLPRLFTRFGRVLTDQTSHIAGTGLGLYVSKQLARLHNGDITVLSQPGSGTTFTVSLPLAPKGAR